MTPQFKTFLITVVFLGSLCWWADAQGAESFRLCMVERDSKTQQLGCWTGSGVLAPKVWLKRADKACKFLDLEYIKDVKQKPVLIKIHCKEEL